MLKAIKVQIYPNDEQINYINNLLGCCRFVYNEGLNYKKSSYESEDKVSVSSSQVSKYITELKNEKTFLRDVHSKVLQQSLRDLDTAFNNFFKRIKKGDLKCGYPRFKSKRNFKDSCRFPVDAFIGIMGNRISLIKKLSDIHFKCSKRDEKYLNKRQSVVKNITLTKTLTNKFMLSILIDYQNTFNFEKTNKNIGLDLGVKNFLITSDGEVFNSLNLKHLENKQKKYQRQLSKKTNIKSKKREQVRIKLAKVSSKISNIRLNYIHNITSYLVKNYDKICIEDLNVSGMIKNHNLAKSIQNQAFRVFRCLLEYKCKWYDKELIIINRFFPSSKKCSCCGYINKELKLSDREWKCVSCNTNLDRDLNASINILNEGLKISY